MKLLNSVNYNKVWDRYFVAPDKFGQKQLENAPDNAECRPKLKGLDML